MKVARDLLAPIQRLQAEIRDTVVSACERAATSELSGISREEEGDTLYVVDRVAEESLIDFFTREIAATAPLVLVAEGLPAEGVILPRGARESEARWRIIVDPIDGTRGLMYQKRSAWILTGVAPNRGQHTTLEDVVLAVQTEIPLVKQHLSDVLWAEGGGGFQAARHDRLRGTTTPIDLRPSSVPTIAHGFAAIARFSGARDELAAIDEEIVRGALGPPTPGKAHCFEDQYICTGGQLYELICGHDRFMADLRPLAERHLAARGERLGICCHPYDLATELIAREAGVLVTDAGGAPLRAPLDTTSDVAWVGYANAGIRAQIEPLLRGALQRRAWL